MTRTDPKFASRVNGELWLAHDYGKIYAIEKTTDGNKRLCIAVSYDGSQILRTLSGSLKEPFLLLYVLIIFRGGGKEGRYQSDELTKTSMRSSLVTRSSGTATDVIQFGCARTQTTPRSFTIATISFTPTVPWNDSNLCFKRLGIRQQRKYRCLSSISIAITLNSTLWSES